MTLEPMNPRRLRSVMRAQPLWRKYSRLRTNVVWDGHRRYSPGYCLPCGAIRELLTIVPDKPRPYEWHFVAGSCCEKCLSLDVIDRLGDLARLQATHSRAEWTALVELLQGRCAKCLSVGKLSPDHVIPRRLGGSDGIWNLQPLCFACNRSKGKFIRDVNDWRMEALMKLYPGSC